MRFYELPFFMRLLDDKPRFVRYLHKLNQSKPEALCSLVEWLAHNRNDVPVAEVMSRFVNDCRAECEGGLDVNLLASAKWMKETGFFRTQSLGRLRSFMSCAENAADRYDVHEYLETELGLTYCDGCDEWEFNDYMHYTWEEDYRCRECLESYYTYSDRYDQYVRGDDAVTALDEDGDEVTVSSRDTDFRYSHDAGMFVHVEYEYEPPEPQVIGSYHSSKNHVVKQYDDWVKKHKRFFGVELEVEMKNPDLNANEKARELNDLINGGNVGQRVFFERDGSLRNGFEIISNPMSLPAHRQLWSWLRDNKATIGMVSHKTTTCGLHVHVSRDRLTKLQIAKMVAFVNNPENQDFMTALARRYGEAATGFCRIKASKAKVGQAAVSEDRYEAVNVTPRHTVEFRIFKGTLKYESLVAAVEFVNALCEYTATCGECSARDLGYESFLKFAEMKLPKETETLRSYVNNRLETI